MRVSTYTLVEQLSSELKAGDSHGRVWGGWIDEVLWDKSTEEGTPPPSPNVSGCVGVSGEVARGALSVWMEWFMRCAAQLYRCPFGVLGFGSCSKSHAFPFHMLVGVSHITHVGS